MTDEDGRRVLALLLARSHRLAAAERVAAERVAAEQAEDEGLWFSPELATEAHLQQALRRLAAAIEGDAT